MINYENTTSYKTILIPSLIIYNDDYYDLEDIQDDHSVWKKINTNEKIRMGRSFKGDEYVMFSEAYILGREVEYFDDGKYCRGFITSTKVVIDKLRTDHPDYPCYDIIVTLDDNTEKSIYCLLFLTEVDNYAKSAYQIFVEILKYLVDKDSV